MARERQRRPDLDERFKIETDDPSETLRRLLDADAPTDEDEAPEEDDS